MKQLGYLAGTVAVILAASVTNAAAGAPSVPAVPELNPASVTGGLALLAGGVMLLRARFRK